MQVSGNVCALRDFRTPGPVGGKGPSFSRDVDSSVFSINSSTCSAQPPPSPLPVASIRPPIHGYSRDSLHVDSATCTPFCFSFSRFQSVSSISQFYPHRKLSSWQLHQGRLQACDQVSAALHWLAGAQRVSQQGRGGISPVSDSGGCRGLPASPDSFNVTHQILCQAYPKNL